MKSLLQLILLIVLISSCNNAEQPNCGNFSDVSFEEFFNDVIISYWSDLNGVDNSHRLQYGEEGFTLGTGMIISTNSCCQITVAGLDFGKTYDF